MRLDPILPFAPSALLPLHHDGARLEAEIQAAHAHESEEREVTAPRAVEKTVSVLLMTEHSLQGNKWWAERRVGVWGTGSHWKMSASVIGGCCSGNDGSGCGCGV